MDRRHAELLDAAFARPGDVQEMISCIAPILRRSRPASTSAHSTTRSRASLTIWGTFQAPHVIRTVVALIAKLPEHKIT